MPNYRWVCKNCETVNPENQFTCLHCDLPADASSNDVNQLKDELSNGPSLPSIPLFFEGSYDLASCPKCNLKMNVNGRTCPHCQYELNSIDRENLRVFLKKEWRRGAVIAIFVFLILFGLATLIVYLF